MAKQMATVADMMKEHIGKPVVVEGYYSSPYTGVIEGFGKKPGTFDVCWDEDGNIECVPFNYIRIADSFAEDEASIDARIGRKFKTLELMTKGVAQGKLTGMIVSGPGGVGKTHTVEQVLGENLHESDVDRISGHISPLALYERLYANSEEGKVTLFDDCDSVFANTQTLNILKAALDSRPHRILSWDSRSKLMSAPTSFLFKGHIVFLTNLVLTGDHYDAFLTRVHHVDMNLTNREILVRIRQVASFVDHRGATDEDKEVVLKFLTEQVSTLKGVLSIRSFLKLLDLFLLCEGDYDQFESLATAQLID